MTKNDVIKNSYGKHWNELNDQAKECANRNDGWIYNSIQDPYNIKIECDFIDGFKYRPKLLQGIEDNNGWNIVDDDCDFPKEQDWYYLFTESKHLLIGFNVPHKNGFVDVDNELIEYRFVTHYQSTQKPKPPIY